MALQYAKGWKWLPVQGKVVNDIIQEWNTELEKRSRAFVRHAEELMEWDRAILSNRHTLLDLEDEVKRVSACMLIFSAPIPVCSTFKQFAYENVSNIKYRLMGQSCISGATRITSCTESLSLWRIVHT